MQKNGDELIINQQSKLTFSGIHKSYKIMIVTHSSKMKCLWISQFI